MSLLAGPQAATAEGFEEFVAQRARPMLGLARALVRNEAQAEDLVQDVLATALVKWKRVCAADDPVAYTNRMLVNAANSWRRRPSRRESVAVLDDDRPVADSCASTETRVVLLAALRTLSPRHRAVLALRYLEDWPDEDIAEVLGIAPSTVRSCAKRGLAALRGCGALDADEPEVAGVGAAEPVTPEEATRKVTVRSRCNTAAGPSRQQVSSADRTPTSGEAP